MTRLPNVDPARSTQMALVRSRDTKPELVVRHIAHALGYRYRLYRRDLPGTPDLVFPGRHKVIFVHGCFWHSHRDPTCWRARIPKTGRDFWTAKLKANATRDIRDLAQLKARGWEALVIWECQTTQRHLEELKVRLVGFLR